MRLYPAIDLLGGRAARLVQGDYGRNANYGDPLEAAERFRADGAVRLHIVDLDAAREGRRHPQNAAVVEEIVRTTKLQVQVGGGIRAVEDISYWLSRGVSRCVLGTAAARDPGLARDLIKRFGNAVTISIDARDGRVATQGWTQTEDLAAVEFAARLREYGLEECIFTDIATDGMLAGPNVEAAVELARASGLRVIVSGGVGSLGDLTAIRAKEGQGISGVIVGTALYRNAFTVAEALAVAADDGIS